MNKKNVPVVIGVGVLIILLLLTPGIAFGAASIMTNAADFIATQEGFSATPYWDVSRWSWGYGTQAPGASGTITVEQAKADLNEHLQGDYDYLSQLIHRPLTANQWAALLSFSYNLGAGNADNLVDNINSGDNDALEVQWKKYVNAGGSVSSTLVRRREAEWQLFIS